MSLINGVRGVLYLFVMPTLLLLTRRNVKKQKKQKQALKRISNTEFSEITFRHLRVAKETFDEGSCGTEALKFFLPQNRKHVIPAFDTLSGLEH